jgi:predicted Na+-dependent transporter
MFNADLALSVTMTAISTILSIFMLPANLLLYSRFSYDDDVIAALDWVSLFTALGIVIGAILLGLFCSAKIHSHKFNAFANKVSFSLSMRFPVCNKTSLYSHSRLLNQ